MTSDLSPGGAPFGRRHYAILFTLIGLSVFASLWHMRDSYLFSDDFLYFIVYLEQDSKVGWLTKSLFGEIVPAVRLTIAWMFDLFGINYVAYQTLIIAWSLSVIGLGYWLARRLGASGFASLFFLTFFIFGLPLTSVQQWFSAAIYILPGLICGLLTLHILLYVIQSDVGELRLELLASLAFICGLAFFPKTIFQTVFIGAVLAFSYWGRVPSASLVTVLWRAVLAMRGVIAISLIYAAVLLSVGHGVKQEASPSLLIDFLSNGLVNGVFLQFFGLGERGLSAGGGQAAAIFAVAFAVLFASFLSVRTHGPRTLLLWAALFVYSTSVMLLIGTERAVMFGSTAASSPRYVTEAHLFMALLFSLAMSPRPEQSSKASGLQLWFVPATVPVAAAFLLVSDRLTPHWDTTTVRRYFENLDYDLQATARADVRLCEGVVPEIVIPAWMQPLNKVSKFSSILDSKPIVTESSCNYVIEKDGQLLRVD